MSVTVAATPSLFLSPPTTALERRGSQEVVRYVTGEEGDVRVVGLNHYAQRDRNFTEWEDPVGEEDEGRGAWRYPNSYSLAVSIGA